MKLTGDYHTHSKYSGDCKTEMEDAVLAAIAKGLNEIAITDHGPAHSGYGIKRAHYPIMHAEVVRLREKYPQIKILLGLEANILNTQGDIDISDEMMSYCDWLNAGYHFGSRFVRDIKVHLLNFLSRFSKHAYEIAKKDNTMAMVNAMRRYPIKMITHPGAKGPIDIETVAKVAAETHTMLEINNSHGHLTIEAIKIAMAYDVIFAANSDAHRAEDIGIVDNSIARIEAAQVPADRLYNLK